MTHTTIYYTFSIAGSAPTVENLRARTWCDGKRIDILWSPITSLTVLEYRLKRSTRTFSLFVDDDTEVVYSGTGFSHQDTGLQENTVYYYTLYWTDDGVSWYVGDKQRVAGLSIKDYRALDGEHWLYDRLPRELRRQDGLPGDSQFELRRMCDVLQCGFQLMRGQIEVFNHLPNYDAIPAGRIGDPENQYAILESVNRQLGFEPQRALGLEVMRRVALGIVKVRKKKGSCPGLLEFVKLLTGWDAECAPTESGAAPTCGGGTLFRTWNGTSYYVNGDGVFAPAPGADLSSTTLTFEDTNATWSPGLLKGALLYDFMGNYSCVADNSATVLTLQSGSADYKTRCFVTCNGPELVVVDPTHIDWTPAPGAYRPLNEEMFTGRVIMTPLSFWSSNITASELIGDTTIRLTLDTAWPGGTPGLLQIAPDVLDSGGTKYPKTKYRLEVGSIYHLWNPLLDLALRGTASDPFDRLWGADDMFSQYPLGTLDVLLWIDESVAELLGTVTASTPVSVTLVTSGAPPMDGDLVGMYLNPNRNQSRLFRIVGNLGSTITVDTGGDNLEDYAVAGSQAFVLSPMDAARYSSLLSTVTRFVPTQTRVFVWFK